MIVYFFQLHCLKSSNSSALLWKSKDIADANKYLTYVSMSLTQRRYPPPFLPIGINSWQPCSSLPLQQSCWSRLSLSISSCLSAAPRGKAVCTAAAAPPNDHVQPLIAFRKYSSPAAPCCCAGVIPRQLVWQVAWCTVAYNWEMFFINPAIENIALIPIHIHIQGNRLYCGLHLENVLI